MDSRERTFIALDHQEPDRVPLDCWVSKGTKHKINSKMQGTAGNLLILRIIDKYVEFRNETVKRFILDQTST
jgi:hypothetical protein